MIKEGFAAAVEHEALGGRLILRPEELFAHATAWQLARAGGNATPENFVREVLAQAELLPHGAVIAALAFLLRVQREQNVEGLDAVIQVLADDEPVIAASTGESRAVMLLEDGAINLRFGPGAAPRVGNLFPWIVLSHLLGAVLDAADDVTVNAKLLASRETPIPSSLRRAVDSRSARG